jgi:hypothetical protein
MTIPERITLAGRRYEVLAAAGTVVNWYRLEQGGRQG